MRIGLAGAGRIGTVHAATLAELPAVDTLLIADADPARARALAGSAGGRAVDTVDGLFDAGLDGLVVAAATDAHAELVSRAVDAGLPVFCEKPLATDLSGTFQIVKATQHAGVPVQVGFQRRFDAGHAAARDAVRSGRLGWIHTLRSCTLDPSPPPPDYVPHSGGLFRDCLIHDIDAVRYVTGRDVVRACAVGVNRGEDYFRDCGDVDTAAALLTLDDDTLALVSATRYNAAGYDVRLEVFGSADAVAAGLGDRTPVTPVPAGQAPDRPYGGFLERFAPAYAAELAAFTGVAAGTLESPCPPEAALEAFYVAEACEISRREERPVRIDEVRQ